MENSNPSNASVAPTPKTPARTILEGVGFFALGLAGFLASYWFAGKIKVIVAVATLLGSWLIGNGILKAVLGDRLPIVTTIGSIIAAVLGLMGTLAVVDTLLGGH